MIENLRIAKVPILSSQAQYAGWASEVEALALSGGYSNPPFGTNTTTSTDAAETNKVDQHEQKAKGLILRTVSETNCQELHALRFTHTVDVSGTPTQQQLPANAQEMWDHLKAKFEKQKGIAPLFTYLNMNHAKLVDDRTMEAQLNKLDSLRTEAALHKYVVQDWQYASIILGALPDSYRNILDAILPTTTVESLLINDVKAKILDQERRVTHSSSSANYNLSSSGNKFAGKQPSHKERANDICAYGEKKGHWANECCKKKRDKKAKPKNNDVVASPSSGDNNPSSSQLNAIVESGEESDAPFCTYLGVTKNWLLDSGATKHMTPYGSDFIEYATYAESKTVTLGDGKTKLVVLGKGKVQRYVEVSPHKYCLMNLDDVLHVKGITTRFISLVRLDDKGFNYQKENSQFIFLKVNITFQVVRLGNAFWIHTYPEEPLCAQLNVVETICQGHSTQCSQRDECLFCGQTSPTSHCQ